MWIMELCVCACVKMINIIGTDESEIINDVDSENSVCVIFSISAIILWVKE